MNAFLTEADRAQIARIEKRGTVRSIIAEVSQMAGISPAAIKGPCRDLEHVRARDMVCYVARREGMSFPQIARELNRDHTTIMSAVRREKARRAEMGA